MVIRCGAEIARLSGGSRARMDPLFDGQLIWGGDGHDTDPVAGADRRQVRAQYWSDARADFADGA